MNSFTKFMICSMVVAVTLYVHCALQAAELIAPTRTLRDGKNQTGRLSVFSEPPQLEVSLDGNQLGQTPIVLDDVKSGVHVLKVKETEKQIFIEPGKLLKLSWFKGKFIEIPDKQKKEVAQPKAEQSKGPIVPKATRPTGKENEGLPLYFPINPRGPIN